MNKLIISILVILIIAAGVGGYFIFQKSAFPGWVNQLNQKGCPEDAKICPDGSVVGRVLPDCEFEPCPTVETKIDSSNYKELKIAFPSKGLYLGQTESGMQDIRTFENAIGKKVALYMDYSVMGGRESAGQGLYFDIDKAERLWEQGYIVMVGAYEASPELKPFTVDKLLKGEYDRDLRELAAQFRKFGKPMFFTVAREPNMVLGRYMGGFGENGDKDIFWAAQNNKGYAEFNPSEFLNPDLYKGLDNPDVCDGLERLAAAQRYYYDFFVNREDLDFLTFESMGWAIPFFNEAEYKLDLGLNEKSYQYKLAKNCYDFEKFYKSIDGYVDWVSVNWYLIGSSTNLISKKIEDLKNGMDIIRKVAPHKPILITELGFCGENRKEKVELGMSEIIKYPEIKAFALWRSDTEQLADCLIRPQTPEASAVKRIINDNLEHFHSCVYFSDGSRIPNCSPKHYGSIDDGKEGTSTLKENEDIGVKLEQKDLERIEELESALKKAREKDDTEEIKEIEDLLRKLKAGNR